MMNKLNLSEAVEGKILVVDDERPIREIYRRTMNKHGVEVITAEDGREAWELFQGDDGITIVITDVDMPEMRGVELIGRVLPLRPLTQIIVITGVLDDAIALYGVKPNIVCLPKPVEPEFVAVAVASSASRYKYQVWEDSLKRTLEKINWDEEEIMAIIEKAPWL